MVEDFGFTGHLGALAFLKFMAQRKLRMFLLYVTGNVHLLEASNDAQFSIFDGC